MLATTIGGRKSRSIWIPVARIIYFRWRSKLVIRRVDVHLDLPIGLFDFLSEQPHGPIIIHSWSPRNNSNNISRRNLMMLGDQPCLNERLSSFKRLIHTKWLKLLVYTSK